MTYKENLEATKASYPFEKWRELFHEGLDQYTTENCDRATSILNNLIKDLNTAGKSASREVKVELFRQAVESLNELNDENDGSLIETGEREDLCELFDQITVAAGLHPSDFGGGEGIATEWRNW